MQLLLGADVAAGLLLDSKEVEEEVAGRITLGWVACGNQTSVDRQHQNTSTMTFSSTYPTPTT